MNKRLLIAIAAVLSTMGAKAQDFREMTYSAERTEFKLLAPDNAKSVKLRIYKDGLDGKAIKTVKMKHAGKDTFTATVEGDLKGCFYTFDVGKGECPGVFAKAVGVNGKRGAVVDMAETDPEGWNNDRRPMLKSPADLIIYEMHHRDYSVSPTSGLANKGRFLALTETKAIEHLKELGVNAVHILPSFDYASIDETALQAPLKGDVTLPLEEGRGRAYNWGYDPVNYNVPEGSYSTDPYTPSVRIKEFKQMVQSLHRAGIRVILDVVYNHTMDVEHSNFHRTFPLYYYRYKDDGTVSDGSGCGNETASEKPYMRRFMIESMKYWAEEYQIDGFRVDLMGIHDIETMNAIRAELDKVDSSIYIYGEGWSAGTCAYPEEKLAMKANTWQLNGIGAFCDDMRDALRGPFSDDTKPAFLNGETGHEESIKYGIAGCIEHPQVDISKVNYSKKPYAKQPTQAIIYVSCHDDMCLVDRLRESIPNLSDDELVRLDLLAQTAVFTSQGIPFMLSGEEFLRTKQGVHNSYNSPDEINQLDWDNKARYRHAFDYYKGLISMRKSHPAFRLGKADLVRKHLEFLKAPEAVVAYRLKDNAGGDTWKDIIVILNGNRTEQRITVPDGTYKVVCRDGKIDQSGLGMVSGAQVKVSPQSALIIVSD